LEAVNDAICTGSPGCDAIDFAVGRNGVWIERVTPSTEVDAEASDGALLTLA
jgi:hypothetical protein